MGQAKNRGSKEQRIADALGLKRVSLSDLKIRLGLPENASFLGYGIHNVEKDEFLSRFEETADAIMRTWGKTPELAISYAEFDDAYTVSRKCKEAIVVGMFDTGTQIYVASVTGD
ncbi:hypothetical protein LIN78_16200 [Leeia sp. TBRC 13508]|uniref:Uncharacterized protein n=1 Tax=Leeia speluncae TaxID=2884804 RepID=A0ABS8DA52_9NEIS|nr:hypothetical protein [Leeia speluncae]MCB6185090.1 hypothetical protein [Leeia speluncae]